MDDLSHVLKKNFVRSSLELLPNLAAKAPDYAWDLIQQIANIESIQPIAFAGAAGIGTDGSVLLISDTRVIFPDSPMNEFEKDYAINLVAVGRDSEEMEMYSLFTGHFHARRIIGTADNLFKEIALPRSGGTAAEKNAFTAFRKHSKAILEATRLEPELFADVALRHIDAAEKSPRHINWGYTDPK